jgi:NAD(P)-dependent dehydrogenase (short-subunit alcohol dehydrogenase family)
MTGRQRVEGKVAIVTGAARGQGAAEARALATEGAKVVLCDILTEQVEATATEIRAAGGDALALRLDVSSFDEWVEVVRTTEETFGPVSALVNNAAIYEFGGVEATDPDQWHRIIGVNQTGPFFGMKAVVPSMRRAGGGSIVNVGSVHALFGSPLGFAYHAAKGALRLMTKAAAVEYARDKIRVNIIHPGTIHTPMNAGMDLSSTIDATPLGRGGQPEEIAAVVLFLISDEASYVTGVDLPVDGGMTASGPGGERPADDDDTLVAATAS